MFEKIYVSPSSQPANTYAAGNTNEQAQCRRIALATVEALKRCGFDAMTNVKDGITMYDRVRESNAWGADLHLPEHTNAFNKKLKGTRMFCSSLTGEGGKACKAILDELKPVVPGESDGVQVADFYEITATKAPCAYVEAAFHDNAEQAKWIIDHVVDIAEAVCRGVCKHFGRKYVAPVGESMPEDPKVEVPAEDAKSEEKAGTDEVNIIYRVQVGAFITKKYAEDLMNELKEKGYDAFVTS